MQALTDYQKQIVEYYRQTEHAYTDAWELAHAHSIHYGYTDDRAVGFRESLLRMNAVMMEMAGIETGERILDAGCGIGGSSFFLAREKQCRVTGISLSKRQVDEANRLNVKMGLQALVDFKVADYCATDFPDNSFDVVWACESSCYAHNKEDLIREAFRVLKPGGRLVVADGFVNDFDHNDHPIIRQWLDGWVVNYLETIPRFKLFAGQAGFENFQARDITSQVMPSSRRLNRFYYLASLYLLGKTLSFSNRSTELQRKNIRACRFQYLGLRKGLWRYVLLSACKPVPVQ